MVISMRAVLIKDVRGSADNLYIGEIEKPTPDAQEVLVKVKAFGLNRMDIVQREGHYPPPPGASPILGVEFSGIISEVGSAVEAWKVGDEVMGLVAGGAYAEYVAAPQSNIVKKPTSLTWVESAGIPENFLTAFQALVLIGQAHEGDHILVHAGASGVGVAAIQIARLLQAASVTATTSTREKIDWLLNLPNGATHGVNYRTEDFSESVKRNTNGHGADVVIDFVAQSHFSKNLNSMAIDGRMVMLALLSGGIAPSVDLSPILRKRLRIEGSTLRSRSLDYQASLIERFKEELLPSITSVEADGPVRVYIHKVYNWGQIVDAHKEMEANKNMGKIIVEIA